jgi:hypothetical protein
VTIVSEDLVNLQKHANSLNGRFAKDLRGSLKTGNLAVLKESIAGLEVFGNVSDEVSRVTEELVSHVKRHGSSELVNTAAQAGLLSAVVGTVEPSEVFWQKTLARRPEPKYYALCKESRNVVEKVLILAGSEFKADQLVPLQ